MWVHMVITSAYFLRWKNIPAENEMKIILKPSSITIEYLEQDRRNINSSSITFSTSFHLKLIPKEKKMNMSPHGQRNYKNILF